MFKGDESRQGGRARWPVGQSHQVTIRVGTPLETYPVKPRFQIYRPIAGSDAKAQSLPWAVQQNLLLALVIGGTNS